MSGRRSLWKIHLSTMVVISLATGAYMCWLHNVNSEPLELLANPAAHPNPIPKSAMGKWFMKLWTTPFFICSFGEFVTGVSLVAVIGTSFEYLARRREARKT
jgi:hypothetical protein